MCSGSGYTCQCISGYYDDNGGDVGGACIAKVILGRTCPPPTASVPATTTCLDSNAGCSSSTSGSYICQCTGDYYDDNGGNFGGGTCVRKVGLNSPCPRPDACGSNNAVCGSINDQSTCVCSADFYDSDGNTPGGSCEPKVGLNNPCPQSDACGTTYAECGSINGQSTCVCRSSYYDNNRDTTGGSCVPKVGLGVNCPMPDACGTLNSGCVSGICRCDGNYFDGNGDINSGGACYPRVDLFGNCNSQYSNNKQCVDDKAECQYGISTYTCRCIANYHSENNGGTNICVANAPLGGQCFSNAGCSDSAAECRTYKCTCNLNHYDSNGMTGGGNCQQVTNLQVGGISFPTVMTNSLAVSWTLPHGFSQYIDKIKVEWAIEGSSSMSNKELTKSSTSTTINNLSPGYVYTIMVSSINTQTESGVERISSKSETQATKPSTPGAINKVSSDLDAANNDIRLIWETSHGIVSSYRVTLRDDDTNEVIVSATSTSTFITLSSTKLKHGHLYKVEIIASSWKFNGNTVESDPRTEVIKTVVKAPTAPTNVVCGNEQPSSISLSWSPSALPNGDIRQYHIKVYTYQGPLYSEASTGTNNNIFTVGNLKSGAYYDFQVYTENERYNSSTPGYSANQYCQTPSKKSDPPSSLGVSGVQSRTLTVTWSDPNNTYSEENFGYVVQIQDPSNTCVKEQIYMCSDCTGRFQVSSLANLCGGVVQTILDETKSGLAGTLTYQASGLLPDTNYTVTVTAFNSEGRGEIASVTGTTAEEASRTPTSVQITDITAKTFIVTWNLEGPRPGKTNFTIFVTADPGAPSFTTIVVGFEQRSKVIENLEEYWNYTVSVTASTSIGSMTSDTTQKYRTSAAAPGKVAGFDVTTPGSDHRQLRVSWKIPSLLNRNGIITGYRFQHNASDPVDLNAINGTANPESHVYKEDVSVVPETFYKFEVWAVNHEGKDGTVTQRIMEAPPGVPINTVESESNPLIPESKVSPGQDSLRLIMGQDFFRQESNGKIRATGLIGCETSKRDSLRSAVTLAEFNSMNGWADSKKEGFTPYRITPADWTSQSNRNSRKRRQSSIEIVYTVGSDGSCETDAFGVYCNGNLNPGTGYIIVAVACTNGGCLLSQQYGPFETYKGPEETSYKGAIIGGVVGAVVAVAVVIAVFGFIVYHRRRTAADPIRLENDGERLEVLNKKQDVSLYRPVLLSNFEAELKEMHKDCNLMFSTLFKDLAAISPKHTQEAATSKENKNKNQVNGILPFDHSRVKLLTSDGHGKDDYINANYLPGYKSPREYIGCQGPISGTANEFWRMVWEQNVTNIVMLVFCKGGQKAKFTQYWPKEFGDRKTFGDLNIEMTSCMLSKNNEDRLFNIAFRERKKQVRHFLTLVDLRAERQHDNMVAFINHVRSNIQDFESSEEFSAPTVVHCSTGAGFTGIYIILDHLMQIINENDFNRSIDIFNMVYRLRDNRPSMVQTEQQLMFIYDCVKVMLESQNTAEYERNDLYEQKGIVREDEHVYLSINETSPYENTRTQTGY